MIYRRYIRSLKLFYSLPLAKRIHTLLFKRDYPNLRTTVFGLDFPHPVGLGVGFDSKGDMFNLLLDSGFAYVQCGPFYDKKEILDAIEHLKEDKHHGIVAVNLGAKTAPSLSDEIVKAYSTDFSIIYDFVDMFIFKIDSPDVDMDPVLDKRMSMDSYKPILFRLSEELNPDEIKDVVHYCLVSGIDGIILGNKSFEKTLQTVKEVSAMTAGALPIIASGGISTPEEASQLLSEGASLLELGEGLLSQGPSLLRKVLKHLNLQ